MICNVSQCSYSRRVVFFFFFRFHAERAIDIITHILPEDHLLLASSKRVKGERHTQQHFITPSKWDLCTEKKRENLKEKELCAFFVVQLVSLLCWKCRTYFTSLASAISFLLLVCVNYPSLALILEEIAIDCHNKETEERLLQEAHDLHLSSLQLAKKAFGEFNVQTAKHYGNLGRLYQSMRKFKVTRLYFFFH